jgi:hypothetical protein
VWHVLSSSVSPEVCIHEYVCVIEYRCMFICGNEYVCVLSVKVCYFMSMNVCMFVCQGVDIECKSVSNMCECACMFVCVHGY